MVRKQMNKQKRNLLIVIAITIICFICFIISTLILIKENSECVSHPFEYSAKKLKEAGGNYDCVCYSLRHNYSDFYFNEDGINIINPYNLIK